MYYAVKVLIEQGKSIAGIAKELGIDRKTVRKIRDKVSGIGVKTPVMIKGSKLDPYKDEIIFYIERGLSAVLICEKLIAERGVDITYSGVKKYVRKLKGSKHLHIPIVSPPGKESQVDFGYAGYFNDNGKKVKVWVFCMRLGYSRYDFYELVTDQSVPTFMNCHIHAFEYFGGVPEIVKIDNLKSGVLHANFYEPEFQHEYVSMLLYYGSHPLACRVRKPEEKGKVESAVKYVKNNFLKSLDTKDLNIAKKRLIEWMENKCNMRIHGTTRKVPRRAYLEEEKPYMLKLPINRYETYVIEKRRVNNYSHISFKYNYYSVPYKYIGEEVSLKAGRNILRIYSQDYTELAVHPLHNGAGNFITNETHFPSNKKRRNTAYYEQRCNSIGADVLRFFINLKHNKPTEYHRLIQGIFSLRKLYSDYKINAACKRADMFGCYSYKSVKRICEDGLFETSNNTDISVTGGGYGNDLRVYDELIGGAE